MSEKVGRLPHDCVRDELPRFHDHSYEYNDGDLVRCSCGKIWLVTNARHCHYREMRGRKLRKLVAAGVVYEGVRISDEPNISTVLTGRNRSGVTHKVPVSDTGMTPCCRRTPFELPRRDRMTLDDDLVTCRWVDDSEDVTWPVLRSVEEGKT